MSYFTLSLTLLFVFIPFVLSKSLKLGLEKDITVATIRSVVQLLAIGYVLQYIFATEDIICIVLMIILMITVATLNARKKGMGIKGITWKIAAALIITQGVLLGFHNVPASAQYIIPISGMMIGNAMVMSVLFLNRLRAELETHENEIELILSLGGTPKQAVQLNVKSAIRASMIPTIEAQRTIGLVQLPGMMSGQIIGGASPVDAVQFQILIVFSLLTCATLASVILALLVYPTLFNEQMQYVKIPE